MRRAFPAALLVIVVLALGAPMLERRLDHGLAARDEASRLATRRYAPPAGAVEALRGGDCDGALAQITPTTAEARVVAALYAHSCGAHADALRRLRAIADYTGMLADWRLWALGRSATELGQIEVAQQALTTLERDHPDSPLAGLALAGAAELALERDDLVAVDALVARGREAGLGGADARRLETIAWMAASQRADPRTLRQSAHRLLVDHPLSAAELEVVEIFRAPDGTLDWPRILDADQLRRRAESLLAADLAPSAIEMLGYVPAPGRDDEWALLLADALIRARRGAEALELLAAVGRPTPAAATRLEWLRAEAAREASVARRGRATSAADRRRLRQTAHDHLRRVVAHASDTELAHRALRRLFADLADDGRFDAAIDVLRALRRIDPADQTGAGHLWRRGWLEFERRNHSSAIGYWAELRALYPDSTSARRATYWSARSHLALGNPDRAQDLLLEVVASPQADFYHRHAMEWLIEPPPTTVAPPAAATWPRDPRLERARHLSELGLDEAARIELELVATGAAPRAVSALRAEILARQGETRRSIVELRRAFPDLGTHRQHRAPEAALRLYYPLEFNHLVTAAAQRHDLSPHLVFAMIRQESAFDSGAHSHAGARGLMQVMPATGRELAGRLGLRYDRARLVEPDFSVQLGTAYFRQVLRSFGDEELALAGYNGGPSRIRRWWSRSGDWSEMDRFIEGLPFEETRTYVQRIVLLSNTYRDLYAG